ncbi:MAG: hypothetical protein QOD68_2639 [Actinomycetota bacterium]|nr:hypothetical protein [Actinomycetota bacterium]
MKKWSAVAAAVVLTLVVAGAALWFTGSGDDGSVQAARRPSGAAAVSTTAAPTSSATSPSVSPTASPSSSPLPPCDSVARPFTPRTISVPGVTSAAAVVTPPRLPDGVPGAPPLTTAGKTVFAFDREQGIRPGDPGGNVLLNAHTWPDGSALGNRLLAGLQLGDRIVVHGPARTRLCYRVSERVEVLASQGLARYYDRVGPPQLALVVCSGRRLGPGNWEKRTIWFARPAA